jgi:hypothetical protein
MQTEHGYFDHQGKFVRCHRIGGLRASASSGEIAEAVANAVSRCEGGSGVMQEIRGILDSYPQLREGGADAESDALTPLIACLVAQQFG